MSSPSESAIWSDRGCFYEALGWATRATPDADVVFFGADDSGVEDGGGWGGVTLAHNVRSPAEVDSVTGQARSAGAKIVREPGRMFWGGYSAAMVDPDGHPWEQEPALGRETIGALWEREHLAAAVRERPLCPLRGVGVLGGQALRPSPPPWDMHD